LPIIQRIHYHRTLCVMAKKKWNYFVNTLYPQESGNT